MLLKQWEKYNCDVTVLDIDLLSFSAHKMYGPKGIGALYVRGGRREIPIRSLLEGGGQENGLRAGTSNVPGIVGFGMACEIASAEITDESARLQTLRDDLERGLIQAIPQLRINARLAPRLPNTTNFTLEGLEADAFLLHLPNLMMSTGAACNTGAPEPSHVLQAIGLTRTQASASIRISLGRMTKEEDVRIVIEQISSNLLV